MYKLDYLIKASIKSFVLYIAVFAGIVLFNMCMPHSGYASDEWLVTTLAYDKYYPSLTIDSNNHIHISFNEQTSGYLRVLSNAFFTGDWITEEVDNYWMTAMPAIAVDPGNWRYISFSNGQNLLLARDIQSPPYNWGVGTIALGTDWMKDYIGWFSDIAVDSNGKIHISHVKVNKNNCDFPPVCETGLMYTTNASGTWTTQTLLSYYGDTMWLYDTSIAIDSNDKVHISYTYCDWYIDALYYAKGDYNGFNIQNWTNNNNLDEGEWSDIAVDSLGYAHIVHRNWPDGILIYQTNRFGGISKYSFGTSVADAAITVDSSDIVHVVYADFNNRSVIHTKKAASASMSEWTTDTVYTDPPNDFFRLNLETDSYDILHLSFLSGWNPGFHPENMQGNIIYATTLCPGYKVKVGSLYYSTLQSAYNSASTGQTIQSVANYFFAEDFYADLNKTITLDSGYDCNFSASNGVTTLKGQLTVSSGNLVINKGTFKVAKSN
jgi:hypothetical protein